MKKFASFDTDKDDSVEDTKKGVVNFITSNFYRFINSDGEGDTKALLMLVAALSVLNSDQPNSVKVARRMAQTALVRAGKSKKG